jgi:hypothetical protein
MAYGNMVSFLTLLYQFYAIRSRIWGQGSYLLCVSLSHKQDTAISTIACLILIKNTFLTNNGPPFNEIFLVKC